MINVNTCHEKSVQHAFNRAASSYDKHAILQLHAGSELIAMVPKILFYARVIDLGCGTGIITQQLARSISYRSFQAIDISNKFLDIAKKRLDPLNIQTHISNFEKLAKTAQHYDLIFSNIALHWGEDLQLTLNNLLYRLSPQGLFVFSIPLSGTLDELNNDYHVRDMPSANEICNILITAGCQTLAYKQETYQVCFNSTLEALRSIKQVGATHVPNKKIYGLGNRSLLNTNIKQLSYKIGYFIATRNVF